MAPVTYIKLCFFKLHNGKANMLRGLKVHVNTE